MAADRVTEAYRQETARRETVRNNLVVFAATHHVDLKPSDIRFVQGEPEIDGMPAAQWLHAMTEETPEETP